MRRIGKNIGKILLSNRPPTSHIGTLDTIYKFQIQIIQYMKEET